MLQTTDRMTDDKFYDIVNTLGYLLCFKLTLASPVDKDMTAPNQNRDEKGVVFVGGETGSNDNALIIAIRNQAKP